MTKQRAVAVIVEDDRDVQQLLVHVLGSAGFIAIAADNAAAGIEAVREHQPTITTIDVTMAGIDGIEAARRIRTFSETYIIMISALSDEADLVLALSAGADDYLTKPFRPRELRARIQAMQRRPRTMSSAGGELGHSDGGTQSAGTTIAPSPIATVVAAPEEEALAHRDLTLFPETRIAMIDTREIELTRTEFDLLAALLISGRRVRSKAELALHVNGENYDANYLVSASDRRTIETHMTNLRRKLDDSPAAPKYIETVRGVGYRLTHHS